MSKLPQTREIHRFHCHNSQRCAFVPVAQWPSDHVVPLRRLYVPPLVVLIGMAVFVQGVPFSYLLGLPSSDLSFEYLAAECV